MLTGGCPGYLEDLTRLGLGLVKLLNELRFNDILQLLHLFNFFVGMSGYIQLAIVLEQMFLLLFDHVLLRP